MGKRRRNNKNELQTTQVLRATDILSGKQVSQQMVDATKDQIRMCLVAQARNEIEKVIRLTKTLDKIQDKYQEKVLEYIAEHDDESAVAYLPQMIDTINRSLEKSYAIINNIVGNDKIMNFQIIQNNISDSTIEVNGSTSIIGDLADPVSREKVRYVMRELLNDVDTLVEAKEVEEVHEVEKDDTET